MRIQQSLFCILILAISFSCKKQFRPSLKSLSTGYLVVEGFINSGPEPTSISISRTIKVYDDSVRDTHEHNALVNIEGQNNEIFPLYETGNGVYSSGSLELNSNEKYRLTIKTKDGKEYASDFSSYRTTSDIDSLTWKRNSDGLKIYINTHDDQNQPGYYYWKYEEVWEIHSAYYSSLKYIYPSGGLIPVGVAYRNEDHTPDTALYKCWVDLLSSNVNIGSSEKLIRDQIYSPIMSIGPKSRKLSVLYCIKVSQYAISKDGYNYLKILKTNSEDIGGIFSPQPSELTGNIHCITNPSEIVVGFIEISQEKVSNRLFISNSEVPDWGYTSPCAETVVKNNAQSLKENGDLSPTMPFEFGQFGAIISFYATYDINCMDCRLTGASTKPPFWP